MSPRRSLRLKLVLAFLLVAVVAVGLVAVLTNRTTQRQFEVYVSQGKRLRAERLAPAVAAYYAGLGNWDGIDAWLAAGQLSGLAEPASGAGHGPGRGTGPASERLIVVADDGRVVADSRGELVDRRLSATELAQGVPLVVDGRTVGTLLVASEDSAYQAAESLFLSRVNRSLLWAGLAASALALALGWLLADQLTAPLRALTRAARRLADRRPDSLRPGEVPQVEIGTRDEIGQLGQAFNHMAQSLARQEILRRNLMADVAHELRTPLSVIRGDLEALLDGVYQPTPEALASLQEEALLLTRLVDDLRALAQAEAGQLRLERRTVDMRELLRGVVAAFDVQAAGQGQTLDLELPSDLPAVDADPQRVRQVVANLMSNALHHAARAGGRVMVSAQRQAAQVQVTVADDGPGIAEGDLAHVFDRFWRGGRDGVAASSGRAGVEGSGLGLAIARELVRAHGGRIWVESTPGRGTAFHFTLDVAATGS